MWMLVSFGLEMTWGCMVAMHGTAVACAEPLTSLTLMG